jgi:hypothetical protein
MNVAQACAPPHAPHTPPTVRQSRCRGDETPPAAVSRREWSSARAPPAVACVRPLMRAGCTEGWGEVGMSSGTYTMKHPRDRAGGWRRGCSWTERVWLQRCCVGWDGVTGRWCGWGCCCSVSHLGALDAAWDGGRLHAAGRVHCVPQQRVPVTRTSSLRREGSTLGPQPRLILLSVNTNQGRSGVEQVKREYSEKAKDK